MINEKRYALEEVCKLVDVSKRTIRYYIQQGLVGRPEGEKRGSYYTNQHLEELLEIKKWQKAGLSLDRIKELLVTDPESLTLPPPKMQEAGEISIWSRVFIDKGVEVQIDASKAEMTPEELRSFVEKITELYKQVKTDRRR